MTEFLEWSDSMGFDDVVAAQVEKMFRGGARVAVGDHSMAPALESEFRKHGMKFIGTPTTNANKNAGIKRMRLLFAGQQVLLDDDPVTLSQILDYREKIGATGAITYTAKAGARADRVSVLVNLMIAEAEGLMSWSPAAPARGRGPGRDIDRPSDEQPFGVTGAKTKKRPARTSTTRNPNPRQAGRHAPRHSSRSVHPDQPARDCSRIQAD